MSCAALPPSPRRPSPLLLLPSPPSSPFPNSPYSPLLASPNAVCHLLPPHPFFPLASYDNLKRENVLALALGESGDVFHLQVSA